MIDTMRKTGHIPKIGDRFGRGVIIKYVGMSKYNTREWELKCDCGNTYRVPTGRLNQGRVKSCGCYMRSELSRRMKLTKGITRIGYKESVLRQYFRCYVGHGKHFEITREQFDKFVFGNCYYCGIEPSSLRRANANGGKFYGDGILINGIDRIDSSIGYTINNCVSCCTTCNKAKLEMSQQNFIEWILRAAKHLRGQ